MSRVVPYRAKTPPVVRQRMDETLATTLYLVQTIGPTSYVVQEQNCDQKHKVLIGPLQACSCGDAEVCIHILFVMLKVLRVPATNPIVWQKSLVDSEVDALLRGDYREKARTKNVTPFLKKSTKNAASTEPETDSDEAEAQRHDLVPGEVCAICQEDMAADQLLTFCRKGCGNNFHIECMKVFGESRKQSKEHLVCPLCRHDWGDLALTELKKEMDIANKAPNVHKNVSCKKCQTKPIRNERYRCVQCTNVDLCGRCFKMNVHINHSFVMKKLVTDSWTPTLRSSQARSTAVTADLVDELQSRDLTTNDYDLLLQLDQRDKTPVQDFLLSVLGGQKVLAANAKSFGEPGVACSICRQSLRIQADVRSIICGHAFHESCLAHSILSKVYVCPHPSCEHVLFPGMHYLTSKKKSTAEDGDKLSQKAASSTGTDMSLCVMALQQQSVITHVRGKTTDGSKTTKPYQRPASQLSTLDISALSIGFATTADLTGRSPPTLPPLKDKPRMSIRPRKIETKSRESQSRQSVASSVEARTEQLSVGQELASTDERLLHAGEIRLELKKLDKDRLRKKRLEREERVRHNLFNNESNQAGVETFLPFVGRNSSAFEEKAPATQQQHPALFKQRHGIEGTRRGRIGAGIITHGDERTEGLFPELSIGAIRRA